MALRIAFIGAGSCGFTRRPVGDIRNVRNKDCIGNLPADAIVEVPGFVDSNGIKTPAVGDLPLGCAAVYDVSINVQRLTVEAVIHGDVELLKQTMILDPLVGAVCNPPEISPLVDEMLIAQACWLPQYAAAPVRRRHNSVSVMPCIVTCGADR